LAEQAIVDSHDDFIAITILHNKKGCSNPINLQSTGYTGNLNLARRHSDESFIAGTHTLAGARINIEQCGIKD
jgi:hypothetical protein